MARKSPGASRSAVAKNIHSAVPFRNMRTRPIAINARVRTMPAPATRKGRSGNPDIRESVRWTCIDSGMVYPP